MKKIITLLLALVIMLSLAACGSDAAFVRGEVSDNVYTNEASGVTFTAPEGYTFYSDEQIASLYGTTAELLHTENLDTIVYDMYCGNVDLNSSINIIYENLTNIYGSILDDASYLTLSLASIETSFEGVEGVSISNISEETITVNGTEYSGAYITLDINGTEFYETIVVKEIDGYMMCCTVAAYDEAEIDNIFSGLELTA